VISFLIVTQQSLQTSFKDTNKTTTTKKQKEKKTKRGNVSDG
jgi:hypothetical protein